jgi:hypothetical protein
MLSSIASRLGAIASMLGSIATARDCVFDLARCLFVLLVRCVQRLSHLSDTRHLQHRVRR